MSNKILINRVTRTSINDEVDTLHLKAGVNILEGLPNSGKTVWLSIIDFLLGEIGSVEEALSTETPLGGKMYEKYISASINISINEKDYEIERTWGVTGKKSKIFVNGEQIGAAEFSDYILNLLEIPILRFPKGNPYSELTWPSLSWRMLLRHIYRQERFWSELVDMQPEVEQHAVLSQFLGFADKLFSQTLGDVIKRRKELLRLEIEREQFGKILDSIGQSMTGQNGVIHFVTLENVTNAIGELEKKITELLEKREVVLADYIKGIEDEDKFTDIYILEKSKEREDLVDKINEAKIKHKSLTARVAEFDSIKQSISKEIEKLERTKESGYMFADLKVTHCPACDQKLQEKRIESDLWCFLCRQPLQKENVDNRIEYEIDHLKSEWSELTELIQSLQKESLYIEKNLEELGYNLSIIEREIAPLRGKMNAFVSPEIGALDADRGRLEEQVENYKRLIKNIEYKTELIQKIDNLNSIIGELETIVALEENVINYEEASSLLENQMANYLEELMKTNPSRWPHSKPTFRIGEKSFSFKVNEGKWSKAVGGTSKLYFILSYHYALLALSKFETCNYPGLSIIDFPPEFTNTESNFISESFVIKPFVDLCASSDVPMQVIITGKSFGDIENVHKIPMPKVWK